jgi:hypothetical protein
MTSSKILFVVAALVSASFAFAADAKKDAPAAAGTKGGCCTKAEKDGKTCSHPCCVAAAKDGKNCEKCGGTNVAKK